MYIKDIGISGAIWVRTENGEFVKWADLKSKKKYTVSLSSSHDVFAYDEEDAIRMAINGRGKKTMSSCNAWEAEESEDD